MKCRVCSVPTQPGERYCHACQEQHHLELAEREVQAGLVEPLWYLLSIPYCQYMQTRHWKQRSASFVEGFGCDKHCELCSIFQVVDDRGNVLDWLPQFQVHHISYDHLGCEPDEDLRLVCSACHNLIHNPDSRAAINWLALNDAQTINPATLAEFRAFDRNNFPTAGKHQSTPAELLPPSVTVAPKPSAGHSTPVPEHDSRAGCQGASLASQPQCRPEG